MRVINNAKSDLTEEVGGIGACFIACGVFCYGTAGAVRNWPESGTERRESASAAHPEGRR